MRSEFFVFESEENGLVLQVGDPELADQVDDFFTEHCFVLYTQKPISNGVEFYFGQLGSTDKLTKLLEKFDANS